MPKFDQFVNAFIMTIYIFNVQSQIFVLNRVFYLLTIIVCFPHGFMYSYRIYWLLGLVGRVFANGPGDLGSIPGRVIPKTLKMGLDTYLLNTQQYKVRIKGKVEQSRERSSVLPYTSV